MSIITGRGDRGETDLLFGKRAPKNSLRIEALGVVDELNASLGLARAASAGGEIEQVIDHIQERLVGLMGLLACLPEDLPKYVTKGYASLNTVDVVWIEEKAKEFEGRGVRFQGWARPGEEHSLGRASLDVARSVARRAERRVWELHERESPVAEEVRLYFNRLSDLLWIMARMEEAGG